MYRVHDRAHFARYPYRCATSAVARLDNDINYTNTQPLSENRRHFLTHKRGYKGPLRVFVSSTPFDRKSAANEYVAHQISAAHTAPVVPPHKRCDGFLFFSTKRQWSTYNLGKSLQGDCCRYTTAPHRLGLTPYLHDGSTSSLGHKRADYQKKPQKEKEATQGDNIALLHHYL